MIGPLDDILGGSVHPADVQDVAADAIPSGRVGNVLGQRGERSLRGSVRGEERLAAVGGHGADVDDRTGHAFPAHHGDGGLREQQRRPHVHRHQPVEQLRSGVLDGAAGGEGGRIDENVQRAEDAVGMADQHSRRSGVAQLGGDESHVRLAGERARHRFAPLLIAAGHDQAPHTLGDEAAGDGLAEAEGAAGDQCHLAFEPPGHEPATGGCAASA